MDESENGVQQGRGGITRRNFMGVLGAGTLAAGVSGRLSGGKLFAGGARLLSQSSHAPTLAIGTQGTFTAVTPLQNLGYQFTNLVSLSMYDPLMILVSPGVLAPAAATSWDASNPTSIVFKIRPGMTFHDGSPITPADVAYSIQVRGDPALVAEAKASPLLTPSQWGSVEVLANGSVQLKTKQPINLATVFCSNSGMLFVVPNNAHKRFNLNTQEVGSGPFKMQSFISGSSLTATRFPNYWRGAAPMESVVFKLFSSLPAQVAALESGSIDAAYDVRPIDLPSLKHAANHTLVSDATYYIEWFPQLQKPPLSDVRVRRALRYCLDIPSLLKVAFPLGGKAVFDDLNLTPLGLNLGSSHRYDPAYAKKLLSAAGYSNLSIPFQTVPSAYQDAFLQAEVMQQSFKAAGINSEIKTYQTAQFISDVLLPGEWEGLCFNAGTIPFPFTSLIPAGIASLTVAGLSSSPAKMAKANVTSQLIELCAVYNQAAPLPFGNPQLPALYKRAQQLEAQADGLLVTFGGPSDWSLPNGLVGIQRSGYGFDYLYKAHWT
jgi:peptide/nickel transport system substrate-binding protein